MRFSRSLGPDPRQPTVVVVWPRRDAPPPDRASGADQRRFTIVSLFNSQIALLLFVVVVFRELAIFRYEQLLITLVVGSCV